ncbi:MAG: hypothetical protein FWD52_02320 [Candidatus Bathyarchaeota archaeon]|nr:hypothetical protein [Candidatus Termiticorpusculum sp.]
MKSFARVELRTVFAWVLGGVVFYVVFSIAYFIMAQQQILDLILTPAAIVATQTLRVLILRLLLSAIFASWPAHTIIKLTLPKRNPKTTH